MTEHLPLMQGKYIGFTSLPAASLSLEFTATVIACWRQPKAVGAKEETRLQVSLTNDIYVGDQVYYRIVDVIMTGEDECVVNVEQSNYTGGGLAPLTASLGVKGKLSFFNG